MANNWDIFDAQRVLSDLTPAARSAGYVLSLYGSVLTDMSGDDLDILATPFRANCNQNQLAMLVHALLMSPRCCIPGGASADFPGCKRLQGGVMSGHRTNVVFEVPFSRVFTRGWLWRKIDLVIYPNLRP